MSKTASRKAPEIKLAENGPIVVTGLTSFMNSRDEAIQTKRNMALCRCGASKNKPFCDLNQAARAAG